MGPSREISYFVSPQPVQSNPWSKQTRSVRFPADIHWLNWLDGFQTHRCNKRNLRSCPGNCQTKVVMWSQYSAPLPVCNSARHWDHKEARTNSDGRKQKLQLRMLTRNLSYCSHLMLLRNTKKTHLTLRQLQMMTEIRDGKTYSSSQPLHLLRQGYSLQSDFCSCGITQALLKNHAPALSGHWKRKEKEFCRPYSCKKAFENMIPM